MYTEKVFEIFEILKFLTFWEQTIFLETKQNICMPTFGAKQKFGGIKNLGPKYLKS